MTSDQAPFAAVVPRSAGEVAMTPSREILELWLMLARNPFRSLVLVPIEGSGVAASLACTIAEIGGGLQATPVTFLVVTGPLDPASAGRIGASLGSRRPTGPDGAALDGQVIVALPPVVVEPLGVAVAHAADSVVVCIEMGRTRTKAVRRTISLLGQDRIAGAILVG